MSINKEVRSRLDRIAEIMEKSDELCQCILDEVDLLGDITDYPGYVDFPEAQTFFFQQHLSEELLDDVAELQMNSLIRLQDVWEWTQESIRYTLCESDSRFILSYQNGKLDGYVHFRPQTYENECVFFIESVFVNENCAEGLRGFLFDLVYRIAESCEVQAVCCFLYKADEELTKILQNRGFKDHQKSPPSTSQEHLHRILTLSISGPTIDL